MIEIDAVEALRLLGLAVETRGEDYRYKDHYESREYEVRGEPACVIGVALDVAGVPLPPNGSIGHVSGWDKALVWPHHGARPDTFASKPASPGYGSLAAELTEEAARIWAAAQSRQDNGGTWGEALDDAQTVARLLGVPVEVNA